jgi:hypothetical protein
MIIYALALIGIMIFTPQGLLGTSEASLGSIFNFKSHFKRFTKAGKEKA